MKKYVNVKTEEVKSDKNKFILIDTIN